MEIITLQPESSLWRVNNIPHDIPNNQLDVYQCIDCYSLYHGGLQPDHFANGLYFSAERLMDENDNIIQKRARYLEEGGRGAIIEIRVKYPLRCIFYDEIKGSQNVPDMVNEIEARLGLKYSYPRWPANFPFIEWLSSMNFIFKDIELIDGIETVYEIIFPHRLLLPIPFIQIPHGIWKRNYRGMAANEFERIL